MRNYCWGWPIVACCLSTFNNGTACHQPKFRYQPVSIGLGHVVLPIIKAHPVLSGLRFPAGFPLPFRPQSRAPVCVDTKQVVLMRNMEHLHISAMTSRLALPAVPAWEPRHCVSSAPAEAGWCRGVPRHARVGGMGGGGRSWVGVPASRKQASLGRGEGPLFGSSSNSGADPRNP